MKSHASAPQFDEIVPQIGSFKDSEPEFARAKHQVSPTDRFYNRGRAKKPSECTGQVTLLKDMSLN
jgi:hypothetical protein